MRHSSCRQKPGYEALLVLPVSRWNRHQGGEACSAVDANGEPYNMASRRIQGEQFRHAVSRALLQTRQLPVSRQAERNPAQR